MTQKSFIDLIFDTVNDGLDEHKRHEDIKKNIEILLVDVVEPIDRNKFSKWGHKNEQSTPKDCWK